MFQMCLSFEQKVNFRRLLQFLVNAIIKCEILKKSRPGVFTYKREAFAIHIGSFHFQSGDIQHANLSRDYYFCVYWADTLMCLM